MTQYLTLAHDIHVYKQATMAEIDLMTIGQSTNSKPPWHALNVPKNRSLRFE